MSEQDSPSQDSSRASERPRPEPGSGVPWEHRKEIGRARALVETITLSLVNPTQFFRRLSPGGAEFRSSRPCGALRDEAAELGRLAVADAFLYCLAVALVIDVISSIPMICALAVQPDVVLLPVMIGGMLLLQLIAPMVFAALLHFFLKVLKGASHPLLATYRIVCFSSAAMLIALLPFVGQLLFLLWGGLVLTTGIVSVQRVGWGKAIAAVVLATVVPLGYLLLRMFFPSLLGW